MKKGKDRIIEAAVACFIEKGVAQTKISEIAAKAKVHQPLIGYHFPTIEDLHKDVILFVLEGLKKTSTDAISSNESSPKNALEAYIRAPFVWMKKNPGHFSLWMYFYYLATRSSVFRDLNNEIRRIGRERIEKLLYRGIEAQLFHLQPGRSVSSTAAAIQGAMTGNSIMAGTEENLTIQQGADLTVAFALSMIS